MAKVGDSGRVSALFFCSSTHSEFPFRLPFPSGATNILRFGLARLIAKLPEASNERASVEDELRNLNQWTRALQQQQQQHHPVHGRSPEDGQSARGSIAHRGREKQGSSCSARPGCDPGTPL